jgi:hypothetical protein
MAATALNTHKPVRLRSLARTTQASKPFARYENDSERDAILKSRVHFGDPMAHSPWHTPHGTRGKQEEAAAAAATALTQRYDADKLEKSGACCCKCILRQWNGMDHASLLTSWQAGVEHRAISARAVWAPLHGHVRCVIGAACQ